MNNCSISGIGYYLPEKILDNQTLEATFPEWPAQKILDKTGIQVRHVCNSSETACDLAFQAGKSLFEKTNCDPKTINFLLLVTQSPDYFLPSTSCILQHRLGLPTSAGALDVNLGCSGYIYGLSLAKGLISANIAKKILLITAETYSKHIHPNDKSVKTIFGDAAAATLITQSEHEFIKNFVLGTDGSGYDKLIVPAGGFRMPHNKDTALEEKDDSGNIRSKDNLFMDGADIFSFTIDTVPKNISQTLIKNSMTMDDIDLFVFHQANKYMLDFLRKICKIPENKFYMNFQDCGNTVSASIPIALARAEAEGKLSQRMKIMLVGFGVGLSWGAVVIEWK